MNFDDENENDDNQIIKKKPKSISKDKNVA